MKLTQWSEIEAGDFVIIQYFNGDSLLEGKITSMYQHVPTIRVGSTDIKIQDRSEWEILTHKKPDPLPTTIGSKIFFAGQEHILLPIYLTLIGSESIFDKFDLIWVALSPVHGAWGYDKLDSPNIHDDLRVIYDAGKVENK